MNLRVRAALDEEADLLAEIERACFHDTPWVAADFRGPGTVVAELDKQLVGFLVIQDVYNGEAGELREREILNLAVLPAFRRLGIGRALLESELSQPAIYYLDVRESNEPALRLYERFGFAEIARRKHYYRSPDETAIVMKAVR